MKFSISQVELLQALSVVSKGISARATLPVLTGVHIKASTDELVFQTTNQNLSIQYISQALVEEEGTTVIPSKLFLDIVKNLPDAAVSLEVTEIEAIIKCDQAYFEIKTLDPRDFPLFPEVETTQNISLPIDTLSSMVKQTARAVSKDESRIIFTGILITSEDNHIKLVATDSYRLAISQCVIEGEYDFEAVISGTFLQDLAGLKKSDDVIHLALSDNQIVARYQNMTFINRRIEGTYPNYKQLLPDNFITRIEVSTEKFVSAIKRVSLLSSSTSPVKCSINAESQTITISGSSQDVGSAEEEMEGSIVGESFDIGFNCGYLIEGLLAIQTDKTIIELQSPLKPGIFRAQEPQDYLYLVMPVRII